MLKKQINKIKNSSDASHGNQAFNIAKQVTHEKYLANRELVDKVYFEYLSKIEKSANEGCFEISFPAGTDEISKLLCEEFNGNGFEARFTVIIDRDTGKQVHYLLVSWRHYE